MTKKEIEEIKSLLTGLAGISGFKSTHKRVDKSITVLDRELSKLHQPTVINAVCEHDYRVKDDEYDICIKCRLVILRNETN